MKKKKILWYSDSPALETGFAQVAKKIIAGLLETGKYEIEVIGVEHLFKSYSRKAYPYKIHKASIKDHFSSELFIKKLKEGDFDILFTFHNLGVVAQFAEWILEAKQKKDFKWINYSPIDNDTIQPKEVVPILLADVPVVYTKYGKEVLTKFLPEIKDKVKIIYHGSEPEVFKKIDRKTLKKDLFNVDNDTFIVTNVNRNQWRKHLAATISGFNLFKQITKAKTKLYLHAKTEDDGGDLKKQLLNLGTNPDDVILSSIDNTLTGIPREGMNMIYNASDVIVSTTLGEGWGLSTTEAMCAEVPFLGPKNTSLIEIVGNKEERGYLSSMTEEWIIPYGYANIPYKLPNIQSFASKLIHIWEAKTSKSSKRKELELKVANALEWCEDYTWEKIQDQWRKVFEL